MLCLPAGHFLKPQALWPSRVGGGSSLSYILPLSPSLPGWRSTGAAQPTYPAEWSQRQPGEGGERINERAGGEVAWLYSLWLSLTGRSTCLLICPPLLPGTSLGCHCLYRVGRGIAPALLLRVREEEEDLPPAMPHSPQGQSRLWLELH